MNLDLDIQNATKFDAIPSRERFVEWSLAAMDGVREHAEMVIRLVDEPEIQGLNRTYRGKDQPTNVLSFPSDLPEVVDSDLLGDLVICAPVVLREAKEQGKSEESHWAHMVVHGVLHLLGYDHLQEGDAETMEQLEREVMTGLGFQDPYKEEADE